MVHLAGALQYLMPMDGATVFFLLAIYRHFSTFKKPWLPIQRGAGGLSFKITKNLQQFFFCGEGALRVS